MDSVVALVALGFCIATISSMVGLGGGVFLVPALVLLFGLPAHLAVGTSLAVMTFSTLSATLVYARQRRIDYRTGLLLDSLDLPGALAGACIASLLAAEWLSCTFGFFLLFLSVYILKGQKSSYEQKLTLTPRTLVMVLGTSFASGLVAGMLGAGGGTIDESAMILALGMSPSLAAGTSVFAMVPTNVFATVPHLWMGNVSWFHVILLAVGMVSGAQVGPRLSRKVKTSTLRKLIGVVFLLIGLRMIFIPYLT